MAFYTTIQDFTGIYNEQPFIQELRNSSNAIGSDNENPIVHWMDCTKISGTDCYCDDDALAEIRKLMGQAIVHCTKGEPNLPGIHFFDNGNYHYMSKLWTDWIREPFDLVVFDHHPDMQPPRFDGILSCGGWVKEVLDHNHFVRNIVLIGVADHLIEEIKNEPSAEFEKYASRVTFIPESSIRDFEISQPSCADKLNTFLSRNSTRSIYISIDKDVLSLKDAVTNWDQGLLTFDQMEQILGTIFSNRKILGVDICGERATNQDFAEGMDEHSADMVNNQLNANLYKILSNL